MKNILMVMIFSIVFSIFAQTYEKIPFDKAGKILKIDKKLELKLELFNNYPNFLSAELYKNNDQLFLNIKYNKDKNTFLDLKQIDMIKLEEMRQKMMGIKLIIDQKGRKQLIYSSTILALGYWGWAFPAAMEFHDSRSVIASYMLIASGSFFIPFYLTKNIDVPISDSRLFAYGGTRGILWGIFFGQSMDEDNSNSSLATSFLSSIAGYFISKGLKLKSGTVESIGVWGDAGILWGWGIGTLLNEDNIISDNASNLFSPLISMTSCGVGYFYGKHREYTIGDGYLLRSFAAWGGQLGLFISDVSDSMDNTKVTVPVTIITSLGSMIAGDLFFRGNTHYSSSDGFLIMLAEGVGSLLGGGLVYIADSKTKADPYVYFGTSLLTGAISSYLIKRSLR